MLKQLILCSALLLSTAVYADDMAGMDMSAKVADTQATKDFKAGMAAMDQGMGHYTGNTDRDFVAGMIPHHQGAISMAETELKYGSDPALKTLATNIIAAQKKEIAFMQDWLAKHPAE